MNKTHALIFTPKYGYEEAKTHCGLRGVRDRFVGSEYVTVIGERWEIAGAGYKPTCFRCKKASANQQKAE